MLDLSNKINTMFKIKKQKNPPSLSFEMKQGQLITADLSRAPCDDL